MWGYLDNIVIVWRSEGCRQVVQHTVSPNLRMSCSHVNRENFSQIKLEKKLKEPNYQIKLLIF